jgi:hypothetical protein
MTDLYFALINQGFDKEEAKGIIAEMKEMIDEGSNPEEVLYEYGLEPDYVFDLV